MCFLLLQGSSLEKLHNYFHNSLSRPEFVEFILMHVVDGFSAVQFKTATTQALKLQVSRCCTSIDGYSWLCCKVDHSLSIGSPNGSINRNRTFNQMDMNGDGVIDRREFVQSHLAQTGGQQQLQEQLRQTQHANMQLMQQMRVPQQHLTKRILRK